MNRSFFEAMLANIFWGFGFTATIWALQGFTLTQILFLRFFVVGAVGLAWGACLHRGAFQKILPRTLIPAIFLIVEILFQVWGLHYTTATNAGFLTVTYILMVPVLERVLWKRQISKIHWLWVAVAFAGTALMLDLGSLRLNPGDFLMLISALGASLHMLSVDRLGKTEENLFFANTMQSLWGAVFLLPVLIFKAEPWHWPTEVSPWIGLAALTFGSTLLAFYLQMRAQKKLSPSVSSLLFLVESPIAAGFGFLLLGERLGPWQLTGGLLVLVAAGGVSRKNTETALPDEAQSANI
jgi:drug/metabolite transporter (DMT)-like permease